MSAPEVGWNAEAGLMIVRVTEHWVVAVAPQIFNDRVVLCSLEGDAWKTGWTAGFCYDKGPAAALAAAMWDPETEHLPLGFKKIAGDARGTFLCRGDEGKDLTDADVQAVNEFAAFLRERGKTDRAQREGWGRP